MKKIIVFILGVFTTSLVSAATKDDIYHQGALAEKSLPKNVVVKEIIAAYKTIMSTPLPVQCGAQTFYANCCGQTVTCGWLFVCVDNGTITFVDYFSLCAWNPALCQGVPACIPSSPA